MEDGASPPPRIPVKRPPRSEVNPPRVSPRRPPLVVTGAGAVSLPPRTSPRSEVTPLRAPLRSSKRPPLRAVGSVVKLSRYYDLKKKRRTSTGVISQVTKDALTADNSQRTASMGVISMGRDGKKHKKQRKKHGLLISRTRARAAADKRAYRFGQSRKKNDISSLQQTTPTLQNTCYLDLDETDLQSHQKEKRHVTSCAPYWPRRAHRGRPSVAHMPSFSHQVCALPSAHALAKHNHTHRISVFILAAFTS